MLTGDDGAEQLTAAQDILRGLIEDSPQGDEPVEGTVLGLHPHRRRFAQPRRDGLDGEAGFHSFRMMGLLGSDDKRTRLAPKPCCRDETAAAPATMRFALWEACSFKEAAG